MWSLSSYWITEFLHRWSIIAVEGVSIGGLSVGKTLHFVFSWWPVNVFHPLGWTSTVYHANKERIPIELQCTKGPFRDASIAFAFRLYWLLLKACITAHIPCFSSENTMFSWHFSCWSHSHFIFALLIPSNPLRLPRGYEENPSRLRHIPGVSLADSGHMLPAAFSDRSRGDVGCRLGLSFPLRVSKPFWITQHALRWQGPPVRPTACWPAHGWAATGWQLYNWSERERLC